MAIEFRMEETVKAPREEVFRAVTDPERMKEWMPNLVRVEKLTDGPVGPGTRFRETRKMMGKEATEEFAFTEFEPPSRFSLYVDGSKGSTGKGEYRFDYHLEETGDGTRIVSDARIDMPGFFGKLMGKLFSGMMKKQCRKDLTAMKEHVEKSSSGS